MKYSTGPHSNRHPRRPGRMTWWIDSTERHMRRYRHARRLGYGQGKGANTLIHKGRKP